MPSSGEEVESMCERLRRQSYRGGGDGVCLSDSLPDWQSLIQSHMRAVWPCPPSLEFP